MWTPTQPSSQRPTKPTTQRSTQSSTQRPTQAPITTQYPSQVSTQPPMQTPTKPQIKPVTQPPNEKPAQPSTQSPNQCPSLPVTMPILPEIKKFTCTKEGFAKDPENPKKFHQCVNMGGYLKDFDFICPGESVFDYTMNICGHPKRILYKS